MCKNDKKSTYCQNPKELKDDIENCSREQIEKCHKSKTDHPCTNNKEETKK